MEKLKKSLALAAALIFVFCLALPSFADELAVKNGALYRIDAAGKEKPIITNPVRINSFDTIKGIGYAVGIDIEEEGSEGLDEGVYFFDKSGKFIKFFEDEESYKNEVFFSPDGKYVVLSRGTYVDRFDRIFRFDTGELVDEFLSQGIRWLDSKRLAFAYIDESKGDRAEDSQITGWLSIVVYDVKKNKLETVMEATATEDYHLDDVDFKSGELIVWKYSVKKQSEWANDGAAIEKIRVPIPAAR